MNFSKTANSISPEASSSISDYLTLPSPDYLTNLNTNNDEEEENSDDNDNDNNNEEEEKKKEEEEEKIPHMCESIGQRPLQGRCPKEEEGEEGDDEIQKTN